MNVHEYQAKAVLQFCCTGTAGVMRLFRRETR
jgi:hypothetical protein